jgi:stage V sporulation protein R
MNLPAELESTRRRVRGYAQEFGLDFFEVIFEVLSYEQMNEIAAHAGSRCATLTGAGDGG